MFSCEYAHNGIRTYLHVLPGATNAEESAEYSEVIDLESSLAAANVPDDAMELLRRSDLMDFQVGGYSMFIIGIFFSS